MKGVRVLNAEGVPVVQILDECERREAVNENATEYSRLAGAFQAFPMFHYDARLTALRAWPEQHPTSAKSMQIYRGDKMKKGRVSRMNAKRGKILIQMVFVLAWAWLAFCDCSTAAADYSFYLDRFEVSGQVNLSDDFDDGVLDPWVIYDPTVEETGGFVSFSNPGTIEDWVLDGVNYVTEMSFIGSGYSSDFVVENGGGDFTAVSRWSPVVPGINQWYEMQVGYEVQQEPHIGIDISVGVGNWDSEFAAIMGIEPGLGISFYRSTDNLLWRHIPINEADLTSADAVLLKLDFYDDTDEFRAGFSLDNGVSYQYFPELIGWDQDTPGHYEWYFSGQTIELQGPTAPLDIERIGIMTECEYVDGIPDGLYPWDFEIEVLVSEPGALDHIDVTNPAGASVESETIYQTEPGLWVFDPPKDASLEDLRDKYPEGTYIFEFYDSENSLLKTVSLDYSGFLAPSPVAFTYPSSNGQTGVSTDPTFTWGVDAEAGDVLVPGIDDEETGEQVYYGGLLPMTTLSWSPGLLDPDHDYHLDVTVSRVKDWAGPDDLPTMAVEDDEFIYYLTFDCINTIYFTTGSPEPIDEIEEVLDFVDEAVGAGTLIGEGPGKSGDNRLNALINMLEEAQSLIEAGLYEDACDQLWSAYRKCDGDPRPPDFVTGPAADDLADMILLVMDELGC
jgi:hypothetical protein